MKKKLLLGLLAIVVVGTVLVAALPAILSSGPGRRFVAARLSDAIEGDASIARLAVRWGGPQEVEGLVLVGPDGARVADLDATLALGLLDLVGGPSRVDLSIGGALDLTLREDGSTSLGDLLPPSRDGAGSGGGGGRRTLPETIVRVESLTITVRDEGRGETVALSDVQATLAAAAGQPVTLELGADTSAGGRTGRLDVSGAVENALGPGGRLTPVGASLRLDVHAANLPVPLERGDAHVRTLAIEARSDDLTEALRVVVEGAAEIDGQSSDVDGDLVLARPVRADGTVDVDLARVTGTLRGERLPTSVLQPLVAGTGVELARDVGRLADVAATFGPAPERRIEITARGEHVTLDARAVVDEATGAIAGETSTLRGRVHPALLAALAGVTADRPLDGALVLERFTVPAPGDDGRRSLAGIGGRGTLSVESSATLGLAGDRTLRLERGSLAFAAERLADGVEIDGTLGVEGASIEIDERITGLVAADGAIDALAARPVGTVTVSGLPVATLARLVPDRAAMLNELLGTTLDAELETSASDDDLRAALDLASGTTTLAATAVRDAGEVRVEAARIRAIATPALVAMVFGEDFVAQLVEPAPLALAVEPFALRGGPADDELPASITVTATEAARLVLRASPLATPARLDVSEAALTMSTRGPRTTELRGVTGVAVAGGPRVGRLAGHVRYVAAAEAGAPAALSGEGTMDELDVAGVERLLGREPGAVSDWTGPGGTASVALAQDGDDRTIRASAQLTRLDADVAGELRDGAIATRDATISTTLPRDVLGRLLAGSGPDAPALTVEADLPVTVTIDRLEAPTALLEGEPVDPARVVVAARLECGTLRTVDAEGRPLSLEGLEGEVRVDGLRDGVRFALTGRADGGARDQSQGQDQGRDADDATGRLRAEGTITGLLDERSALSTAGAVLTMTLDAERLPTMLLDGRAGFGGLLVAAIGPMIQARLEADRFSRDGGTLRGRLSASNGWLETTLVGRDEAFLVQADAPLAGELEVTPPLTRRVLGRLHPLLADIRTTEQPVRLRVTRATVPADGDVGRLDADVEITIGAVEFDSGSLMLRLLKLSESSARDTFPGHVEPIVARIREGVVTYDRFAVTIGKPRLVYSGRVNLVTQTVDLRTEVPLSSVATSVRELRGLPESLVVPIVTRGRLGALTTEIAPQFLRDVVDASVRETLNDVLEDEGIPLGDILGDILGGGRRSPRREPAPDPEPAPEDEKESP